MMGNYYPPTFHPSNLQELYKQYCDQKEKKPPNSQLLSSIQLISDMNLDLHARLIEENFLIEDIDKDEHTHVEEKKKNDSISDEGDDDNQQPDHRGDEDEKKLKDSIESYRQHIQHVEQLNRKYP
jgi:hypothetical protein